jgi:hypothetical protein
VNLARLLVLGQDMWSRMLSGGRARRTTQMVTSAEADVTSTDLSVRLSSFYLAFLFFRQFRTL